MAGHNKWSKIKRKKGVADAKRSKIWSKIIREIMVAVKEGGSGDPEFNPRLRTAVSNAKGTNMPKDNVERAIKKALEAGGEGYTELTYEGYAPGGIALFVECTTDNLNRTVSNVRSIFNKNGGSLSTSGSVDYMFDRKGIFVFPLEDRDMDEMTLELIDGGAEEVELDDGEITVTTVMEDFGNMQKKLDELGIEVSSANLERIPQTSTALENHDAKKVLRLIDLLEDDDDVQAVFHNLEISDELMSEIE
ncbi:MAG: YebC/PmpR family DNA-binding transcriptional regulator [Bacteroidia bacterium]|nr:YebC/PmpR family DNA-binding transcriptional regulator [Bacteroidia bacterium]